MDWRDWIGGDLREGFLGGSLNSPNLLRETLLALRVNQPLFGGMVGLGLPPNSAMGLLRRIIFKPGGLAHKSLNLNPGINRLLSFSLQLPSIIYGMWGLFYFAPVVQSLFGGNGVGLLTAGIVLAIMIVPFMEVPFTRGCYE